ncbi:MAG: exopolysaccharide transport family protein [Cyclobacteriaceae bacterium]
MYYIKVLLRKKFIVIGVPLISIVCAYFFTQNLPEEFTSTAQLSTGFTVNNDVYFGENFDLRDANMKFTNVIETMKSQLVINLLSYRLFLHDINGDEKFKSPETQEDIKHFFDEKNISNLDLAKYTSIIKSKLENYELLNLYVPEEKTINNILEAYGYSYNQLSKNLFIYRINNSDYINIEYTSHNPFLSSYIVNTLSEEFIKYDDHLKSNKESNSLNFYAQLLEQKKEILESKKDQFNLIKNTGNLYDSETKMALLRDYEIKQENLQEEINSLEIQRNNINQKIQNLNINNQGDSRNNNLKIIELQNKINELQKIQSGSTSPNPEINETIKNLRDELKDETNKLRQLGNNTGNLTYNELVSQKENIELNLTINRSSLATVNKNINDLKSNAYSIASQEEKVNMFQQEVDKAMEEYLQVLDNYNTEKNKSLASNNSINLIVPGQPSDEPSNSKRVLIIISSGIATFMLSVFFILLIEYLDFRIKSPRMLKNQLKLDVAGSINSINAKKLDLNSIFSENDKGVDKFEIFKENIRKIRYAIENNSKDKVYLMTSTQTNVGKSFTILCLAYSLSLLNKRILIIDTNFKNNTITRLLMPDTINNLKLMENKVKLLPDSNNFDYQEDEYNGYSIISATAHSNIDLIGSRIVKRSPSEIFSDKNFNEMINNLSIRYDYIFLEGAALNEYSDTKELVKFVDKVIPVFSADTIIKQKDRESIEFLNSLNGKLTGAILNKVELKNLEM